MGNLSTLTIVFYDLLTSSGLYADMNVWKKLKHSVTTISRYIVSGSRGRRYAAVGDWWALEVDCSQQQLLAGCGRWRYSVAGDRQVAARTRVLH